MIISPQAASFACPWTDLNTGRSWTVYAGAEAPAVSVDKPKLKRCHQDVGAWHQRGLPNVNLSILHNHRGCYHRFTKDRTVIVWVFVAYKISLLPYKWQAVKCDMINVKVLESDHSFSIVEMFSFSITVSLVPLVFTARLNLRANCDGAFKYVIKGKHGWGFWQEPGHKPF